MLRKFIAGLSALLLTAGLVTVIGGAASAHTPIASANCTAVTVNLTNYDTDGVNHVKVTQAGVVTADEDFGASYQSVLPFVDATKANTWKVEVTAWDDLDKKGKSQGYSKTFSGTTKDCAPPPVVHKVEICHATGSQSHPYSNDNQWVSWSSVDNTTNINWNGHGNHGGDIIPPFADFAGKNWPAGEAIWNNDCRIPRVTVVPANPVIVDQCGVESDSVTFATTAGVTYTRDGNNVIATLQSGYVWGAAPSGWVSYSGGKFKFPFDALSTKPCYVLVAWDMKAWGTPNWPAGGQTYVMDEKQTTPDLNGLDAELNAIGYGCYQIDLYYDDATTTALIAGGKLYGPNNPTEHLAYGAVPGNPWKFLQVNETCVHPPVEACVDNHKMTVDWATFTANQYELYSVNCEQPKDLVTDSEWTDGEWACNDTTVEQTGTHTVTPYVKVDGVWVPGTPVVTPTHQTRTLSANEIKPCYVVVAWAMPEWDGFYSATWPQTYVMDQKQTVPNVDALDDELDAIGYGCYQVDVYYDSSITADLIEGGYLTLPGIPDEDLIPGGWGTAYKLYKVGNSCDEPEPEVASVSFTQENTCRDLNGSGDLTVVGAHLVSATWDGEPYDGPLSDFHTGHYDATSEGNFVLTYEADEGYSFGENPNVLTFTVTHKTAEECATPVAVLYNVEPTPASCDADGVLDTMLFPIIREGYTLTVDRSYDGPGVYTITATAHDGYKFGGEGNLYVRTKDVTVDAQLEGPDCYAEVEPTLEATITPMCIQNVPFLDWTATLNDPDDQSENPDNTVTFTFVNTKTADGNWVSAPYALSANGDGTWSGSGRFAWPSATYTGTLPDTITGTGWPGFEYDADADEWTDVGNLNNGWTRGGVDIFALVNPQSPTMTGVQYPAATNPCSPFEISNTLDAPPADPVEAEAQYAG